MRNKDHAIFFVAGMPLLKHSEKIRVKGSIVKRVLDLNHQTKLTLEALRGSLAFRGRNYYSWVVGNLLRAASNYLRIVNPYQANINCLCGVPQFLAAYKEGIYTRSLTVPKSLMQTLQEICIVFEFKTLNSIKYSAF